MKPEKAMRIYAFLLFFGASTLFIAFCAKDSLTNPFVWIGVLIFLFAFCFVLGIISRWRICLICDG